MDENVKKVMVTPFHFLVMATLKLTPEKRLKGSHADCHQFSTTRRAKDPEHCTIFEIYKAFGTPEEIEALANTLSSWYWWVKLKRFYLIKSITKLPPYRERYLHLMNNPKELEEILQMVLL